jgi:hypothetical protein
MVKTIFLLLVKKAWRKDGVRPRLKLYLVSNGQKRRKLLFMNEPLDFTEITVALTSHGRYTWKITSCFKTSDGEGGALTIKKLDQQLRDLFPDYSTRGTGRAFGLDKDEE